MANHSIEKIEKGAKILGGILGGVAMAVLAGFVLIPVAVSTSINNGKKIDVQNKINDIDEQINDKQSEFFGSIRNANEINDLKEQREELRNSIK